MMGGKQPRGYTIVEALIFLAVTSALFVAVVGNFSGQQGKAEFISSVRQMDSRIQDTMNDISTGFYPVMSDLKCRAVAGGPNGQRPQITPNPAAGPERTEQGSNQDCTYIGRVMKFNPSNGSSGTEYNILSIVGLRRNGTVPVQDMTQASPTVLAHGGGSAFEDSIEKQPYPPGLQLAWMRYDDASGGGPIGAFGVFTTFSALSSTGGLQSGSAGVDVYPIVGSSIGESSTSVAGRIENMNNLSPKNPTGGITMCFQRGNSQHALIRIGGSGNSNTATFTEIVNGGCP